MEQSRLLSKQPAPVSSLTDNFEAYFPSQQATVLQAKLWILNPFGEQYPLNICAHLKNDPCQQAFINC